MSNEDPKFDTRVVEHHIRRNDLTLEALQKHLDSLKDEGDEGEPTETQFANHWESRAAREGQASQDA